jgi:hypothetical protein
MKEACRVILSVLITGFSVIPLSVSANVAPPVVEFEKAVHFRDPKGEDIVIPPGVYGIEGTEDGLKLLPSAGGNTQLLGASIASGVEDISEPFVESLGEEDQHILSLYLPDGRSWTSTGSYSGIRGRGFPMPPPDLKCGIPGIGFNMNKPACRAWMEKQVVKIRKENLKKCIDSARNGPERKKVSLFGHEFNCKRAKISNKDGHAVITGVLSHHLSFRTDDQVGYNIVKAYDPTTKSWKVINVYWHINKGGDIPLLGEALTIAGAIYGVPIPGDAIELGLEKLAAHSVGNWKKAAEKTLAGIALSVQ